MVVRCFDCYFMALVELRVQRCQLRCWFVVNVFLLWSESESLKSKVLSRFYDAQDS